MREGKRVYDPIAHSFGGGGHPKAAGSTFDGCGVRDMIVRYIFIPDEERERIAGAINDTGETYPINAEDLKKKLIFGSSKYANDIPSLLFSNKKGVKNYERS